MLNGDKPRLITLVLSLVFILHQAYTTKGVEYQRNGTLGSSSPPAMPQQLYILNGCQGAPK